jgi:tetratricopeptide (TPR) repeat protein/2-polyprenyl-3-methyl-5-hydroxy-6-metoxy-1,4-benzoquinol methylase
MPTTPNTAHSTNEVIAQAVSVAVEPTAEESKALIALFNQRQYAEAEQQVRTLLIRFPNNGFCYKTLGVVLRQQGEIEAASAAMQQAVLLLPNDAVAHYNFAVILKRQQRLVEAESSYRKVLELEPNFAPAHHGLGEVLKSLNRFQEAEICYRQAIKVKSDFVQAFDSLAQLFTEQNDWMAGLRLANQYLQGIGNSRAKSFFVQCVTRVNITKVDDVTLANILNALSEPWCNPGALTPIGAVLVKSDAAIQPLIQKMLKAWPERLSAQDLLGTDGLKYLESNPLLIAMLVSTAICDIPMERFLTTIRSTLLSTAEVAISSSYLNNAELDFYCALARQCFINEHVYACTNEEAHRANTLRDELIAALETHSEISVLQLVTVATYFPLHKLPQSERLLQKTWPDAVRLLLIPLLVEPSHERQLRTTMPQLTPIEGEVSLAVQGMYEENPYPRWIKRLSTGNPVSANDYVCSHFPLSAFQPLNKEYDFEVLVAGCGTGQHSIGVAQKFKDAQVLAIDLSLSSLSYAKRKTQELGLVNVEYAQADIMKLGSINRSFDVIESGGVLHHLGDPWAGWRVLLSLLRPGGVMGIALYSEMARRDVVRGRTYMAKQKYASTPQGIRQCRQDLMDMDAAAGFGRLMKVNDFFSMSDCRDLLFHVQEHRMSLTEIDSFLRENNLVFLGLQVKDEVLTAYKTRFPNDPAATNLEQWQIFENEHPDTFIGMYQFWLQKQK